MMVKAQRRRRAQEPVEVNLTLRLRFGEQPGETITVMDNQRVPMVGSVFESRDRILRAFTVLLLKSGLKQPAVAREFFLSPLAGESRRAKRAERGGA